MYDQLNETSLSSAGDKITKISDVEITRDATLNIDNIDFNFSKNLKVSNVDNGAEMNTEVQKTEILTTESPPLKVSNEGKVPKESLVSDAKRGETPDVSKVSDVEMKSGHEDGLDDLLDDLF